VAVVLWAERGYHAVGVAELCRKTGIGKGAFYHHVESKDEILFEIHNRFVDPMLAYGRELLEQDLLPSEAIRALGERLLQTIAEHRYHCAVFIREMTSLSPKRFKLVRDKRREFEQIVFILIERGMASGEFRPEVPAFLATQAFLALHNYVFTWLRPDGRFNASEVAEAFDRIFLDGVMTERADE
jgi:AcrR family transcriptional regulator